MPDVRVAACSTSRSVTPTRSRCVRGLDRRREQAVPHEREPRRRVDEMRRETATLRSTHRDACLVLRLRSRESERQLSSRPSLTCIHVANRAETWRCAPRGRIREARPSRVCLLRPLRRGPRGARREVRVHEARPARKRSSFPSCGDPFAAIGCGHVHSARRRASCARRSPCSAPDDLRADHVVARGSGAPQRRHARATPRRDGTAVS